MPVRLKGYRELLRATNRAGKQSKREVRSALRDVGDIVRQTAASRFARVSPRSAAGYRVRVRQSGVSVEQSLRKTTGRHPEFGALQMRRALIPAVTTNERRITRELERAVDRIADHFDR